MADLRSQLRTAIDGEIVQIRPLRGGCVGEVVLVSLADGQRLVAKVAAAAGARLDIEADMLAYLRQNTALPVPQVYHAAPELLVIEHLPGESYFTPEAEEDAAAHLAALHSISAPRFGFDYDTLIGGLRQPNSWTDSWPEFFGRHRLEYMAIEGLHAGRLPVELALRVGRLAENVGQWLMHHPLPGLIHGDAWTNNILATDTRVTGFIDPAIYFAHPEVELAFTTLFRTFGQTFYRRYAEIRPIAPGFFEERCELYNLYPLLVHVRLFGGGYVNSVAHVLSRFGY